ncbi:hypothetical protein AB0B57_27380 [Micromonospora sp. NPDC049101]|uniref:hypothetical protein n=1 Tax=unclassified Micromonospora TaxID=2617518 RepID=UPI0033FB0386
MPAPICGALIHRHAKNLWRITEPDLGVRETGSVRPAAWHGPPGPQETTHPTTAAGGLFVTFSKIRVLTAS